MIKMQKAFKNLKAAWAGKPLSYRALTAKIVFVGAACFLTFLSLPQHSQAVSQGTLPANAGENTQIMTYEVYAGGINALTAELTVAEDPAEGYFLSLEAVTKGLLGKLAPWEGLFETEGILDDDGTAIPQLHRSVAIWRGEKEIKEYTYDKHLSLTDYKVTEDGKDKTPKIVNEKLTEGTIDALTATLAAMKQTGNKNDCSEDAEIFDGKRRYKLVFTRKAIMNFESSRYNAYQGQAIECVVEVLPVAGDWHKKPRGWMSIQEQGRDKGTLPTVWLAQIDEDGPAVPVKVRVKTDYGTLFMHLKNYQSNDIKLSSAR